MSKEKDEELESLEAFIFETLMGFPMSESSQAFIRAKVDQVLREDDARKVFKGWSNWAKKSGSRVRNATIMYEYYLLLEDGVTHEEIRERLGIRFALSSDGIKKIYDKWQ